MLGFAGFGGSIGGIIATLLTGYVVAISSYVPVFTFLAFMHITAFVA